VKLARGRTGREERIGNWESERRQKSGS
jgi:hypothetical protein